MQTQGRIIHMGLWPPEDKLHGYPKRPLVPLSVAIVNYVT